MDKTFTPDPVITDELLKKVFKEEKYPSPKKSSLEFVKNFARNFRICNGVEGRAQELLLN